MAAKFTIHGDGKGGVKAVQQLNAALSATEKDAEGAVKATKRLEQQARRLAEQADPQKRYNRQMQDLEKHVRSGRLELKDAEFHARRYGGAIDKAGDSSMRAFGPAALSSLKSYVLGLGSIAGVVTLIRQEWDAIARREERAAQAAMTTAESEGNLRRIIANDPKKGMVLAAVDRIADLRDMPEKQINQAMAAAYGASGSAVQSVAMVEEASRQTRDPGTLNAIASGIGFVMKSARLTDAKEAAGLLNQILAASPIKDEKVPQASAKVIASFLSPTAGGTAAGGGAALATLSQLAADTEGDRSRTGVIQLITKTEEFFNKNRRRFGLAAEAVDEMDERMAILMDDKNISMAKEFIKTTTFEAPVRGGMAAMFLTPGGRQSFRDSLAVMSDRAARVRAANATAAFISGGDLQAAARTTDVINTSIERSDLRKAGAGKIPKEDRDDLISKIAEAQGAFEWQVRAGLLFSTGPSLDREEAINVLRTRIDALEFRQNDELQSLQKVPLPGLNADQEEALGVLREMLTKLENIERQQQAGSAVRRD